MYDDEQALKEMRNFLQETHKELLLQFRDVDVKHFINRVMEKLEEMAKKEEQIKEI